MSIDRIGRDFTFGEGKSLILELMRESGSHLFANLAEFNIAASQSDVASILHAEWYMNVHRDHKKVREPIQLPRPWSAGGADQVSADERAEYEQQLRARSAFAE